MNLIRHEAEISSHLSTKLLLLLYLDGHFGNVQVVSDYLALFAARKRPRSVMTVQYVDLLRGEVAANFARSANESGVRGVHSVCRSKRNLLGSVLSNEEKGDRFESYDCIPCCDECLVSGAMWRHSSGGVLMIAAGNLHWRRLPNWWPYK